MFYINGEFVTQESAKISILDLAVLRGFGAFEFLRTYHKKPFHLMDHLYRFQYTVEKLGLTLPKSLPELEEIISILLQKDSFPESYVKLILTGGMSTDHFHPQTAENLIIFSYPANISPSKDYIDGITVASTQLSRSLPTAKSTQYTPAIVAMKRAKELQPKEILYLNEKQEVLEGATSNFFALKGNTLFTCNTEEVLFGITREVVLRLLPQNITLQLHSLPYDALCQCQEAFITSSSREVMPVVQIDSHKVGLGTVGPFTQHIQKMFKSYTLLEEWPPLEIPRHSLIDCR